MTLEEALPALKEGKTIMDDRWSYFIKDEVLYSYYCDQEPSDASPSCFEAYHLLSTSYEVLR